MGGKNRLQAMELRLRTVLRSLRSAASTLAQRAAHAGVCHQSRAAQFPPFDDLGFLVAVNGQLPKPTCRNHPCTVIHDLRRGSLPPLPDRRTNRIVRAALCIRVEADRRFPSGRGRFRKTTWRLRPRWCMKSWESTAASSGLASSWHAEVSGTRRDGWRHCRPVGRVAPSFHASIWEAHAIQAQ